MPEGPELHLSSVFINRICKNFTFSGKVSRNPVHKSADIVWDEPDYSIRARSRGKELMLQLYSSPEGAQSIRPKPGKQSGSESKAVNKPSNLRSTTIHFTFGMSGKFEFTPANELLKHSHLIFYTKNEPNMALSFVDYRRFGRWSQDGSWSTDRGPCIIQEYDSFIRHIASNLQNSAFNKPICETMLNQKFFNGLGNYLRAEILYRCQIPPFEQARKVLQLQEEHTEIKQEIKEPKVKIKEEIQEVNPEQQEMSGPGKTKSSKRKQQNGENSDSYGCKHIKLEMVDTDSGDKKEILAGDSTAEAFLMKTFDGKAQQLLRLCHTVPLEVVELGSKKSSLSEMYYDETDSSFNNWLQCYYQPGMKNLVDHNSRTIWFSGPPGSMVPKEQKNRRPKTKKSSQDSKTKKEKNSEKQPGSDKSETVDTQKGGRLTRKKLSDSVKPSKKSSKVQNGKGTRKSTKTGAKTISEKKSVTAGKPDHECKTNKGTQVKSGSRVTRRSMAIKSQ